jgi:hypothetical protein
MGHGFPGEPGNAIRLFGEGPGPAVIVRPRPVFAEGKISKIEPAYQEFSPLQEIPAVIKYDSNST